MFVLLIALFFGLKSNAQDYNTGIGLRGGWGTGLTIKHFLGENKAIADLLPHQVASYIAQHQLYKAI